MGAIQYFILLSWSVALLANAAVDQDQEYYYYDDDAEHCVIQHNYQTPYVSALNERVDIVGGCSSQEVTRDDKEVHVINILQNSRRRGRENVPTEATDVTLKLSPRKKGQGTAEHRRRLVFVLNSEQPVVWHIQNEHMSNTSRHLFWISRNSRLHKERLELRIKIKKKDLPHEMSELMQWVRTQSEAGALTSYAELRQPAINTIHFKVGIDDSLPAACEESFQPRSDVTASSLHTQNTNACMAPSNEGHHNRDVHIIEVHSSPNSPKTTDIVMDIKAHDKRRRHRRLVLVLKSHSSVKWKIHTRGVRGVVEIIADDEVDTNSVQVHSVSVAAERLTNIEGADLITWTRERYGPAVSYTEATEANKFLLYIDGAAHAPTIPQEDPVFPQDRPSPFESPARTRKAITISQTVHCGKGVLLVTLRKRMLHAIGVYKHHLSLLDESCLPKDNATHYIFETSLDACGTTVRQLNGGFVFENSVVLHKLSDSGLLLGGEEISGSGYDLSPPDETRLDDEDFAMETDVNMIQSDFTCHKSLKVPHADFRLTLYRDENFQHSVTHMEFPYHVESADTLYLEAKVTTDPQLQIVVQDCWVPRDRDIKMYMIFNECRELGVERQGTGSDKSVERFSVRMARYIEGKRGQRAIVCGLGLCNPTANSIPGVEQCTPLQDCHKSRNYADMSFKYWTEAQIGPLVVQGTILETDSVLISDPETPQDTETGVTGSSPCSQQQGPPGLDSTTVVVIAFAAFIIGVLLVLALWLIYAKTVPRPSRFQSRHNPRYLAAKNSGHRARFAETSGESTPSSTAPITIHQVNHH